MPNLLARLPQAAVVRGHDQVCALNTASLLGLVLLAGLFRRRSLAASPRSR